MTDGAHLARHWLDAAARPEVRRDLEAVYADAARAIAERGPACWASGRCCNFEKAGHLLYVSGLEAAYTVLGAREGAVSVSRPAAAAGGDRGPCPFQVRNLCGVHEIKPLGCRVYFCDRSAQRWQEDLSERLLAEIRAIHDRHRVEYRYGEWRSMLSLLIG